MNIEELRRQSIEQYASLRRKAMFEAQQNSPIMVTPNAAAGGASGGGSSIALTPFIIQSWGIGESVDWTLYRLSSDGSKTPVENAPPLEGPTVFTKNTQNGLHYFVTYNDFSETANFGSWDSITGEWQFLEEAEGNLRNLVPASLQYVEGTELDGNYFIYTDNSLYFSQYTDTIAPKTYRIGLYSSVNFEMSELHEWEVPSEFGSFPISTFYQLPVDTEAIPPQDLYQVSQFGFFGGGGIPLSSLSLINGDTYARDSSTLITIDGIPIDAVKVAYILDRTDYEGITYFNVMASDKINETTVFYIAKFDPASETPNNLTSIYQYSWDNNPYVALTII